MFIGDDGVDTAMNCLVKASTLLTLLAWLNFFQVQNLFHQLQYIFLLHGCVPSGFSVLFQRNKKLATDGNCLILTVQLITTLQSRNKTNYYFKPIIVGKKTYPLVFGSTSMTHDLLRLQQSFQPVRFETSKNLRFRHHDTRQRMHLVLTSLPLRRKSNSTKLAIMSTWDLKHHHYYHRIHVKWIIYLHGMVDFDGKLVSKYTIHGMDPVG